MINNTKELLARADEWLRSDKENNETVETKEFEKSAAQLGYDLELSKDPGDRLYNWADTENAWELWQTAYNLNKQEGGCE